MKKPLKIIFLITLLALIFASGLPLARAEYPENIRKLLEQIVNLKAQIAMLQVQLIQIQGKIPSYENVPAGFAFSKDLKFQDYSDDVKYLQTILKKRRGFLPEMPSHRLFRLAAIKIQSFKNNKLYEYNAF